VRWGYLLGFLLWTPYRWWQRQHSLHHANNGNLDKRGPGEVRTMTMAECRSASHLGRLGYRLYRNPVLLLGVGPSLVFLFERRFPRRGMTGRMLFSVVLTNLALVVWPVGLGVLAGWQTFLIMQGTMLVVAGAVGAWMLYIQHQYEETYYQAGGDWNFELAALQGSSFLACAARMRSRRCSRARRWSPSPAAPTRCGPSCGTRSAARSCPSHGAACWSPRRGG
jgi:omega-6 fatty acid desaturase (delta-12 desaturase)